MRTISQEDARKFLLYKQGLLGERRFVGQDGVISFIKQAGCIQFDPIDVCGRNADLTLQSRVKDYNEDILYRLLYVDRQLVDAVDKNLAIFPIEDWPYFKRNRTLSAKPGRSHNEVMEICEKVIEIIYERGPVAASDLEFTNTVDWYWSKSTLSRAALEYLYYIGALIIHHKKGTKRYYDLAKRHIQQEILEASDPNSSEHEYHKWHIKRRIGAVGALWNNPSDAWLCIRGLNAVTRSSAFKALEHEGSIIPIHVHGFKKQIYILAEDESLLDNKYEFTPRMEFLAPLDPFLWDRKLIVSLFHFDYKWEIYTPVAKRKFGYYVLPMLLGDRFVGRIELVRMKEGEGFEVKNIWWEEDFMPDGKDKQLLDECIARFSASMKRNT